MEWTASKVDSLQINKGQEFQNNDGLSHSDMNAVVNNALYAVKKTDENSAKIEKLEKNTEGIITSNGITRTTNELIIEDNDLKVNGNIIINDGNTSHNVLEELNEKANATNVEEKFSLKADLVNGKIPVSQLPDTGITVDTAKNLITGDSKLISADYVYNGLITSLYNMGAFDTISGNVITRQTGYVDLSTLDWQIWGNYKYIATMPHFEKVSDDTIPNIVSNNNNYPVVIRNTWNSTSTPTSNGITVTSTNDNSYEIIIGSTTISTVADLKAFISSSNWYIQYKLATPYTEEIIEGQPLITLDSQGSQWLREEWEKGLNLFNGSRNLRDWNLIVGNTYTITTIDGTHSIKIAVNWYSSGEEVLIEESKVTFKYNENQNWRLFIDPASTQEQENFSDYGVMCVEGLIAYPYKPYNGAIVHMKELDEVKDRLDILDRLDNTDNINIEASYSYGKDGSNYNRAEYIKITNNSLQNITITSIDNTRIIGTQQATISSGNSVSYSQSDTSSSSGASTYTITINYQIGNVNLSKKYTIVPVKVTSE